MLTGRLKVLEEEGIVHRTTLPPPAGSNVYELTELGRSLELVIVELSRWGASLLGAPLCEDDLRPVWAAVALRSVFDAEAARGSKETYEFRIDGEVFHVRVEKGGVEARQGTAAADPDLVAAGATEAFIAIAAGRMRPEKAVEAGSIWVEGSREEGGYDVLVRCLRMLEPVASGSG